MLLNPNDPQSFYQVLQVVLDALFIIELLTLMQILVNSFLAGKCIAIGIVDGYGRGLI